MTTILFIFPILYITVTAIAENYNELFNQRQQHAIAQYDMIMDFLDDWDDPAWIFWIEGQIDTFRVMGRQSLKIDKYKNMMNKLDHKYINRYNEVIPLWQAPIEDFIGELN